jgi:hypothetical protein
MTTSRKDQMPDTIPLWTDDETMNLADPSMRTPRRNSSPKALTTPTAMRRPSGRARPRGNRWSRSASRSGTHENAAYNGRKMFFHCVIGGEHKEFGIKNLKKAGVALNPEINWTAFRPGDVQPITSRAKTAASRSRSAKTSASPARSATTWMRCCRPARSRSGRLPWPAQCQ